MFNDTHIPGEHASQFFRFSENTVICGTCGAVIYKQLMNEHNLFHYMIMIAISDIPIVQKMTERGNEILDKLKKEREGNG